MEKLGDGGGTRVGRNEEDGGFEDKLVVDGL